MPNRLLAGRRILLPARSAGGLATGIAAAGGRVEQLPLLDRRPVPSPALDALPERLRAGEADWLVVTSAFTVVALAELGRPLEAWGCPQVLLAAVGPASARAVEAAVGRAPLQPSGGTGGAALAAVFPEGDGLVVVPGAVSPSPTLRTGLLRKGWRVEEIAVYRTLPVAAVDPGVREQWRNGCYDALVVTSASVAAAAAALIGPGPVVAVGRASALAAVREGFGPVQTAPSAEVSDVVGALATFLN